MSSHVIIISSSWNHIIGIRNSELSDMCIGFVEKSSRVMRLNKFACFCICWIILLLLVLLLLLLLLSMLLMVLLARGQAREVRGADHSHGGRPQQTRGGVRLKRV